VPAKEAPDRSQLARLKPLLMVDIDGVISLFGAPQITHLPGVGMPRPRPGEGAEAQVPVDGSLHWIDGTPHFLSSTAAAQLLVLADTFDLVWASGWEEKANEHLPRLLGLPAPLPFLRFSRPAPDTGSTAAHWKLERIEAYAGRRALAWIDDAFNAACHEWAKVRPAPTLLVATMPEHGLTAREAQLLMAWAEGLLQR
jgi:hypothetical protein